MGLGFDYSERFVHVQGGWVWVLTMVGGHLCKVSGVFGVCGRCLKSKEEAISQA